MEMRLNFSVYVQDSYNCIVLFGLQASLIDCYYKVNVAIRLGNPKLGWPMLRLVHEVLCFVTTRPFL